MAKGYFPSVEQTDAQYEMLNRLLMELCDLLRVLMVTRGADLPTAHVSPNVQLPDLLANSVRPQLPRRRVWSSQTPPTSPSCSFHHLSRTFSEVFDAPGGQPMGPYGDDEVFCPPGMPTAPAPVRPSLPPRQRRRRIRTSSLRESRRRSARSKSDDCPEEVTRRDAEPNQVETRDQPSASSQSQSEKKEEDSEGSLVSTLMSKTLSGPICTAVVIVLGWRFISNMR